MLKRPIRTSLLILAAVGVAIVILVAVLLLTPAGGRSAAALGWSVAAGGSGLELSIDSVSGSLLRGIVFGRVRLTTDDGTQILWADSVGARVATLSPGSKRVGLEGVRITGARLLFATDADGRQVGWSGLGSGGGSDLPDDASGGAWEVGFGLTLDDVTVEVFNETNGLALIVGPVDGTASGTVAEFTTALEGAVVLAAPVLSEPLIGKFEGDVRFADRGVLAVDALSLYTSAGDAVVTGTVWTRGGGPQESDKAQPAGASTVGPSTELTIESTHELPQLAAFFPPSIAADGLASAGGSLSLTSEFKGPFTALSYSSRLRAERVSYGAARIELLTATIDGDTSGLSARSLHIDGLGGALDATAAVRFPAGTDSVSFASIRGAAEFADLELTRLAAFLPGAEPRVAGAVGGSATFDWTTPGLSNLNAAFDLNAERLVTAGSDLGSASVSGSATGGLIVAWGACCGTSLAALGRLADDGPRELRVSISAADLAVLGSALGADELAGSGTVEIAIDSVGSAPSLTASAELPDLRYGDIQAGPVHVEATGVAGAYDALYDAFDSTLLGTASIAAGGDYSASVIARSFDLAAVLDDSLREAMSLAGIVSGSAKIERGSEGGLAVSGEITELDMAVRRQSASLTEPFHFVVSPDSVRVSRASLVGTFGELSVAGNYRTSGAIDAALTFDGAELSEIAELAPRPPDGLPRGQLRGDVSLAGTRESPVFSADIALRDFEMFGLSLDSATLDATGDSTDVVFSLTAASTESGHIWISGGLPVRPDSLTVLRLDAGREFGVSVASSGFILDAREPILPGIRGEKRFRFDGSALLTGTVDSLASVAGSGLFTEMSASFDLAELSLADTAHFEIDHGRIDFDDLVVEVERLHVLGEPAGGRVSVGGFVSLDGETRVTAGTSDLDMGHLTRALGGTSGSQLKGRLDAEVLVEGTAGDKRASFSWSVDSPRLFDLGFDAAAGSGAFDSGVLTIENTELTAGDAGIGVTGRVTTNGGSPEFHLELVAERFNLRRLTALPPGIDSIEGRLDIDLTASGSAASPGIEGTATLAGGELLGFGLADAITDIGIDVECSGTTLVVRRGQASSGGGKIDASGIVDLSPGPEGPTFLVLASLESPRLEMKDLVEGRVAGNLSWGGTPSRSLLKGRVALKDVVVTRSVGLGDVMGRGPRVIVIKQMNDPRANVVLDLDIEIEEAVEVKSNVARLSLEGGASVAGTMLSPRISGSIHADGGTFNYLDNSFEVESLNVDFIEAERHDPYVRLAGTADVTSRSGDAYSVTARVDGYLNDVVPELASAPVLSQPDIVSLLTFGSTFGTLVSGGGASGSSGDNFTNLAQRAFLSSAFGLAEKTLERLLHLDRIAFEEEELASGNAAGADVMIEKEFGSRVRVNYTTAVGRLSNQRVAVSFELARRLWLETRTNPEGNHAIGVKLQVPFK